MVVRNDGNPDRPLTAARGELREALRRLTKIDEGLSARWDIDGLARSAARHAVELAERNISLIEQRVAPRQTTALLVALGPNKVAVPTMAFASLAEGLRYVTPLLGEPRAVTVDELNDLPIRAVSIENAWAWYGLAERLALQGGLAEKFFTGYYDGCGEVWALLLGEAAFATPLVAFDLD